MEKTTFTVLDSMGNEVTALFVNEWRKTRNGFRHETTLFLGSGPEGSARVDYCNRTWECYEYQTVMSRCVRDLIEQAKARQLHIWKSAHGYERMSPKRREAFEEWAKRPDASGSAHIDLLGRILQAIEKRR